MLTWLRWVRLPSETLMNRVDVATDDIMRREQAAEDMEWFRKRHTVLPKRKTNRLKKFKNTSYSNFELWDRVCFVTYSDLPCKVVSEKFCCHSEFRITGTRRLKKLGLSSPHDLINADPREVLRKVLRLKFVDAEKLGRMVRYDHGYTKRTPHMVKDFRGVPVNQDRRIGELLLRSVQHLDENPTVGNAHWQPDWPQDSVQNLLYNADRLGLDVTKAIYEFPSYAYNWLLPPSGNQPWEFVGR